MAQARGAPRLSDGDVAVIRTLIVDDAVDMRRMISVVLREDGRFEIVGEATDGKEAIEQAAAQQPDVIVLDLMMPVLGGVAAIPYIRKVAPDARILAFTAGGDEMMDEAVRKGADAYLDKSEIFELAATLAGLAEPE